MAALAATSSATPSLQSLLLQRRVLQARREADQAEANAENLRQQADEQDRVVQQARQRVQGLEKQSSTAPGASQASTSQASNNQTTTPTQNTPTYAQELASVFYLAKPILASDLSDSQKNIVKDSLFEATSKKWAANPSQSTAIQSYSNQVVESSSKTMGRLLNTTV